MIVIALAGLLTVAILAVAAAVASYRRDAVPVLGRAHDLSPVALTLRRLGAPAAAAVENESISRLRRQLMHAGLRDPAALHAFLVAKGVLALVGLGAVMFANAVRIEPIRMVLPIALGATAAGFFLPNLWLQGRVAERLRNVERALPDTLDLLVTCVEAGLGLDAAMQRVADETALAFPILSRELRLAFLEVKAGIPRMDALRRLADRTGSHELRSLSATLAQTELFGTSVGGALRVQAESIRIRRMQRAEEKAAYIAVKMTFPLVVCILPAIFAVLVGPAVVNIADKLMPVMRGGG
jgi:tight adherence protein C